MLGISNANNSWSWWWLEMVENFYMKLFSMKNAYLATPKSFVNSCPFRWMVLVGKKTFKNSEQHLKGFISTFLTWKGVVTYLCSNWSPSRCYARMGAPCCVSLIGDFSSAASAGPFLRSTHPCAPGWGYTKRGGPTTVSFPSQLQHSKARTPKQRGKVVQHL